uniref:Uncharacterized protein n=1 Tax=Glossina pallidipes TaxID=7398 RepID=A0A1A9ZNT3_GLOPL
MTTLGAIRRECVKGSNGSLTHPGSASILRQTQQQNTVILQRGFAMRHGMLQNCVNSLPRKELCRDTTQELFPTVGTRKGYRKGEVKKGSSRNYENIPEKNQKNGCNNTGTGNAGLNKRSVYEKKKSA